MKHQPLTPETIATAATRLSRTDPALATVLTRLGPPPLWKRPQNFATFVRIILEQQVSLASARSTFQRLHDRLGGSVTAAQVIDLGAGELHGLGFSRPKARYAIALADDVLAKRFRIASLRRMSDERTVEAITSRLGLGIWSANVYLMMALLRPDIIPLGDLALVKGLAELDHADYSDPEDLLARTECWRPYRSVAARMVWQSYLDRRGQQFNPS